MKRLLIAITIGVLAVLNISISQAAEAGVSVTFSDAEIRIISAWYDDNKSAGNGKGNGKGKRNRLPPGIAKNLARGKSLPPGIAMQHLPGDLQRALPATRSGYERVIVDGRVLLVEVATQVIHDVLTDVFID